MELNFYTDGSYTKGRGLGLGLHCPELNLSLSQRVRNQKESCGRAEILALQWLLQILTELKSDLASYQIIIWTDSQHLHRSLGLNAYQDWLDQGKLEKKADLDLLTPTWLAYQALKSDLKLQIAKVKAHSHHCKSAPNNVVDRLARSAK